MDGYDSKPSKGQFSKSEGENRVVYDNNEVLDFCDSTKGKFSQVPPYRGSYGGPTMSGYDGNLHSHGAYSGPRYESSAMGHYSGASSSGSDRTYMMGYTTERKSPQSYEQEPALQTSNVHEDHQHRGEGGVSGMTGFDYYSADAMLRKKDFFASERVGDQVEIRNPGSRLSIEGVHKMGTNEGYAHREAVNTSLASAPANANSPNKNFDVQKLSLDDPVNLRNFLMRPAPRDARVIQCYIKRSKTAMNRMYPEYVFPLLYFHFQAESSFPRYACLIAFLYIGTVFT